jgi:cullin-associated NEDD8-dissociated protein 1
MIENRVLASILKLLEDKISEVKNQAVKWCASLCHAKRVSRPYFSLGVLTKVVRESQMEQIMDKLIDLSGEDNEETRDIAGLGPGHHE